MFKQYKLRDYRFSLIILVISLSALGIMIIGSAQRSSQNKQLYGLILGIGVMIFVSLIDYSWMLSFSWLMYLVGAALLVAVLIFGENVNNATRWIRIGVQFQPSDLVKIILILFFSSYFYPPRKQ